MIMKRKIIEIDEEKCNGCGLCIPDCPEGALQIIDGKARLVSDLFCDGLGACIGTCPKNAIKIVEREAEPYNERKVMDNVVKQGENVIKAHLEHLKVHGETKFLKEAIDYLEEKGIESPIKNEVSGLPCGCPGSKEMDLRHKKSSSESKQYIESELRQWPVQLSLVSTNASYFDNANLLIVADCVPFAYGNFHQDFLKNKSVIIFCPKLDDIKPYREKLIEIFKTKDIKSITLVNMEVPCCFGMVKLIKDALDASGKDIEIKKTIITTDGKIKE